MGLEDKRLAAKQVHTPETVLGVAEKGQPGWATRAGLGAVVLGQYPANDVLVDLDTEYEGGLLGDPRAPEPGITSFRLDDRRDELGRRPLGPGLGAPLGREQ